VTRSLTWLCLSLMVILNMSVAFGQGQPVSHEKVAGILRNDLSVFGGYLAYGRKS